MILFQDEFAEMPQNMKSFERFRTVNNSAVVCQLFKRSILKSNLNEYILYRYVTFSLCYPPVEGIKPLKVCHSLSVYFGVFYDTIPYAQILFSFNF